MTTNNALESSDVRIYANCIYHTDIYPNEVVRSISPKCIEVRALLATETAESIDTRKATMVAGGFCGHVPDQIQNQKWSYERNEDAPVFRIRLHADGTWRSRGGNRYKLSAKPIRFHDMNV